MNRRTLLLGLSAACALPAPRSARAALLHLFEDPARARPLGRAYLATVTTDADALAAAVTAGLPGSGRLRTEVAALIRADYAAGRIECLNGWLLSRTEARLCAIAALS
jgi:hypothetical protein